jgi:regulator of sigma E protease
MISALVFILVLAILIFVHEMGHFLVAKLCGVGVLEFALGFGKIVTKFKYGETTYSLRAVPLGGFVRMVGDDPNMRGRDANEIINEIAIGELKSAEESVVSGYADMDEDQKRLLKDKTKWFIEKNYLSKLSVVLAGPGFNFIFALLLGIGYFHYYGKEDPAGANEPRILDTFPGHPAEKAGMKSLDLVESIDGNKLSSWEDLAKGISASDGKELTLKILRPKSRENFKDNEELTVKVTPSLDLSAELAAAEGKVAEKVYKIGIAPYKPRMPTESFSESMELGTRLVGNISIMMVNSLWGMIRGLISPVNLGGPISIYKATSASAERGAESVISLLIFLNVSLAIFNLLPIPILDGGHLVLFTIESLKGSPISIRVLERINQVGFFIILLLMIFAFGNDIRRLF